LAAVRITGDGPPIRRGPALRAPGLAAAAIIGNGEACGEQRCGKIASAVLDRAATPSPQPRPGLRL
jgi:hypothetical protein